MPDNRIFNVNGLEESHLGAAIELAFAIAECERATHFRISKTKGLILYEWPSPGTSPLLSPMKPKLLAQIAMNYLESDAAKECECEGWDANSDHDGHNSRGWRVYVDDWGHIEDEDAICAIKPAFMWYGK